MSTNNVTLAEEYYTLIGEKNADAIKKYLHPEVKLSGPLGVAKGKEEVYQTTYNFMQMIRSLKLRASFGKGDQVMVVHDSDIPGLVGSFPGAVLLSFRSELISKIELFYDASRVQDKKEEVFL